MGEHIVCPSGLSGEVRGLTTKDADILAGATGKNRPLALNKLLAACWESTTDSGPYAFEGKPVWTDVLQGDRQYALIQIRQATHGAEYAFGLTCPDAGCRHRFEWALDLDELETVQLSDEGRAQLKAGNRFETEISDGTKVFYRLPTGSDELKAMKLQQQHRDSMVTLSLRMRILEVEGVDISKLRKWVNELPLREATDLLHTFQDYDCGVETEVEVECTSCLGTFDVELPFDGNFFFPSAKKKKKKAKAEAASEAALAG